MSPDDISDDDVEALLAKFFRNYQGVPVIPGVLCQFDSWYGLQESRVLFGYLAQSEGEELVVADSEDEPSPLAKKRQVVRKRASVKSVSSSSLTREGSQSTKAVDATLGGDEATSGEVVATAKDAVSVAVVEDLPVGVPLVDSGAAPELAAPTPSATELLVLDQAVLGLPTGVADVAKSPVIAAGALLSDVITSGLGKNIVPLIDPVAPSTRPAVAERKRVQLPPWSSRDVEDTILVDTGVDSGPSTTLSGPLFDLTMDDAPEVDTSRLGAAIFMLQEVIRSAETPVVPSGSGGVPSSMSVGGTLALVVSKADEAGAPGAVSGGAPEP
ncbi:uncharacterized protein [Setaria viridis]|uniref:uncharacterized protein n=1 Tax=Setaria viridis TaxID=4556 RepID=UPI0014938AA3|nr:uncharacterized protein LOC117851866 [Setaria viridis]